MLFPPVSSGLSKSGAVLKLNTPLVLSENFASSAPPLSASPVTESSASSSVAATVSPVTVVFSGTDLDAGLVNRGAAFVDITVGAVAIVCQVLRRSTPLESLQTAWMRNLSTDTSTLTPSANV